MLTVLSNLDFCHSRQRALSDFVINIAYHDLDKCLKSYQLVDEIFILIHTFLASTAFGWTSTSGIQIGEYFFHPMHATVKPFLDWVPSYFKTAATNCIHDKNDEISIRIMIISKRKHSKNIKIIKATM